MKLLLEIGNPLIDCNPFQKDDHHQFQKFVHHYSSFTFGGTLGNREPMLRPSPSVRPCIRRSVGVHHR